MNPPNAPTATPTILAVLDDRFAAVACALRDQSNRDTGRDCSFRRSRGSLSAGVASSGRLIVRAVGATVALAVCRTGDAPPDEMSITTPSTIPLIVYGLSRLFGSASDLSLLAEYQFDTRPDTEWPAQATRGIYAGIRLALNDTGSSEARAGAVHDLSSHSWLIRAEFTRRLTDQWGLHFEYHGFGRVARSPALRDFSRDSHATFTLRRYL
jgi:hypothetical protein